MMGKTWEPSGAVAEALRALLPATRVRVPVVRAALSKPNGAHSSQI